MRWATAPNGVGGAFDQLVILHYILHNDKNVIHDCLGDGTCKALTVADLLPLNICRAPSEQTALRARGGGMRVQAGPASRPFLASSVALREPPSFPL